MTAKKKVAKKKAGKKKAAKKNAAQESGFNGKLSAYTFVITGTLESFSREEAQAAIEAHGGKVVGSISGKTNCAVVGADPGSKADKAKKLGLMILDEAAFGSLVGAGAGKKSTKKKATKKKVDKEKAATNKTKAVARKTALGGALEILMAERTLGGEEAVDYVQECQIDIVLLDMHMHHMTGLETIRVLKDMNEVRPCILITSDDSDELRRSASEVNVHTVLPKPVRRQQLVTTVSLALHDAYDEPLSDDLLA